MLRIIRKIREPSYQPRQAFVLFLFHLKITRRLLRDKNNPLDSFSDKEIMRNCRLKRGSIYEVCETLQADLEEYDLLSRYA
jgi:hypothetical protein